MKIIPVLIVVGIINGSAFAQTKQVIGTAGYLSEWEISGTVVTERSSAASDLFARPGDLENTSVYAASMGRKKNRVK